MRLFLAIGACLLGGCTLVYDNQYDDRAGELEESRVELFPAEDGVKLFASGGERLYWVDFKRPDDVNVLHSIVPPALTATTYEWSKDDGDSTIEDYTFSSEMIAPCTFGTTLAFASTADNSVLGMTSNGDDNCAVDGTTVYFLFGRRIDRWRPGIDAMPITIVDFDIDTDIEQTVDAFGVIGNLAVFTESGGDIYTLDLATKETTWLENDAQVIGSIFFDERGVIFETINADGPHYIQYEGKVETSFKSMVADGGYHLSFKHGDIHVPADTSEFAIHDKHIIYRSKRGIFAYGLETGHVIDLLLDRGEGFEAEIEYHRPVVTSGGFLHVQGENGIGTGDPPIFQVDLNGRLK